MACEIDELQTCTHCGYLVSSCNGCPDVEIAARDAEIAGLKSDLQKLSGEFEAYENRTSTGVHSCNDECQRPNCVLRRDNMTLRSALAEAREIVRPFADYAGQLGIFNSEMTIVSPDTRYASRNPHERSPNVGDCRRAAAWLAKGGDLVAASEKGER